MKKLVMIGNGMAGIRTIEEILKLAPEKFQITIFGEEPHPNYNRIKLSNILQGDTSFEEIIINPLEFISNMVENEFIVAIEKDLNPSRNFLPDER